MSDSGQHPAEGGFGPPPGAGQWSQPGPAGPAGPSGAQAQPVPPASAPGFPPPSGAPAAYPPPPGQPYGLPPTQQGRPAYPPAPAYASQQAQQTQAYAPAYQPGYPSGQQPGQPAYAGYEGYAGYAPTSTSRFPVGTFILLILSAISLIATGIIGIPSAIVAVIAWRRSATDPASATKLSTTGWIVYAANFALGVPLLIWFYVWALSNQ